MQFYTGSIDEARVSSTARSAAWIAASHASQVAGSTLLQPGKPESRAGWYSGWRRRLLLEIDHQQVAGDLTNFPFLVRLTQGNFDFSAACSDGHDIRFTAADGTTTLVYEREEHDSEGGKARYWVRLPLISSSSNTLFYLYYDNKRATADHARPEQVWDANQIAVWHLNDANGEWQYDATANANHLKRYGEVEEGESGPIGGAVALSGRKADPRYLLSPVYPEIDTSAGFSYSAWACPTNQPDQFTGSIISLGGGNWNPWWLIRFGYVANRSLGAGADGYGGQPGKTVAGFEPYEWSHVAMTLSYDAVANASTMKLYINGDERYSDRTVSNNVFRRTSPIKERPFVIGAQTQSSWPGSSPDYHYNGWIDEARVSNITRSGAWINASYNNQKPDSTMLRFGSVEPPGGSVILVR